jgi:beta-aspartyl-dipeptidase (metallo-type)
VPPYHGACLKPVMAMLERTGLPIAQLLPSHVNQTDAYMADAIAWAERGGFIDVGANYSPDNNFSRATPPAKAITRLLEAGVPLAHILLSSDGNGAPPKEEQREGQPAVANYMPLSALHATWRRLIVEGVSRRPTPWALSPPTSPTRPACSARAGSPPASTPTS